MHVVHVVNGTVCLDTLCRSLAAGTGILLQLLQTMNFSCILLARLWKKLMLQTPLHGNLLLDLNTCWIWNSLLNFYHCLVTLFSFSSGFDWKHTVLKVLGLIWDTHEANEKMWKSDSNILYTFVFERASTYENWSKFEIPWLGVVGFVLFDLCADVHDEQMYWLLSLHCCYTPSIPGYKTFT